MQAGHIFRSNASVLLFLLLLCFIVRFPFFFPAVISWDESTLILMGQSVLDGQLPYVTLWDNKPPLSFLIYAFIIGLFGKSVVAVRVGGLLFVTATAYLTFVLGKTVWSHRAGLIAAILCIFFVSTARSGQATMTETIAILPIMGALSLLVVKKHDISVLFAVGFLFGIASLVRMNLAYAALFVGAFLLFRFLQNPARRNFLGLSAYAAAGITTLLLSALPYLFANHGKLWLAVDPTDWTEIMI